MKMVTVKIKYKPTGAIYSHTLLAGTIADAIRQTWGQYANRLRSPLNYFQIIFVTSHPTN